MQEHLVNNCCVRNNIGFHNHQPVCAICGTPSEEGVESLVPDRVLAQKTISRRNSLDHSRRSCDYVRKDLYIPRVDGLAGEFL